MTPETLMQKFPVAVRMGDGPNVTLTFIRDEDKIRAVEKFAQTNRCTLNITNHHNTNWVTAWLNDLTPHNYAEFLRLSQPARLFYAVAQAASIQETV